MSEMNIQVVQRTDQGGNSRGYWIFEARAGLLRGAVVYIRSLGTVSSERGVYAGWRDNICEQAVFSECCRRTLRRTNLLVQIFLQRGRKQRAFLKQDHLNPLLASRASNSSAPRLLSQDED